MIDYDKFRGDIQPFLELALVFRSHGHQVRLATHESFRSFVTSQGLDFYPLAGDPVVLSEFMVKTQGCIIPTSPELIKEVTRMPLNACKLLLYT